MSNPLRAVVPCLVVAYALMVGGCDDDCDHPLEPGGGWTTGESILVSSQAELDELAGVTHIAGNLSIH